MSLNLQFACESVAADGTRSVQLRSVAPSRLVIAGWTGRDAAAIAHHIEELEAIGVPRPSSVPLYYRVGANLLTQAPAIEALGAQSSGEAEPVLFFAAGEWWLTVGSDHTDRQVETYSVARLQADVRQAGRHRGLALARRRRLPGRAAVALAHPRGWPLGRLPAGRLRRDPAARSTARRHLRAASDAEGRFMTCGTLGALAQRARRRHPAGAARWRSRSTIRA